MFSSCVPVFVMFVRITGDGAELSSLCAKYSLELYIPMSFYLFMYTVYISFQLSQLSTIIVMRWQRCFCVTLKVNAIKDRIKNLANLEREINRYIEEGKDEYKEVWKISSLIQFSAVYFFWILHYLCYSSCHRFSFFSKKKLNFRRQMPSCLKLRNNVKKSTRTWAIFDKT